MHDWVTWAWAVCLRASCQQCSLVPQPSTLPTRTWLQRPQAPQAPPRPGWKPSGSRDGLSWYGVKGAKSCRESCVFLGQLLQSSPEPVPECCQRRRKDTALTTSLSFPSFLPSLWFFSLKPNGAECCPDPLQPEFYVRDCAMLLM